MANYGLYYTGGFSAIPSPGKSVGESYRVDILQLDYVGAVNAMNLSTTPAVLSWDTDDPKAPVKGSTLKVNILGNPNISIDRFYAVTDNTFKTRLWWESVQSFSDNKTIVVTDSGENSDVWLSGFYAPTGNAKTFTFNGNTYNIISYTFTNGTHIKIGRIPAATYAATDYAIGFQVDQLQFEGFLVQDDFIEDLVDYNHEFTLSANDSLGLLKGFTFDQFEPVITIGTSFQQLTATAPHSLRITESLTNPLRGAIGDQLIIVGTPFDNTYTINAVVPNTGYSDYSFVELISSNAPIYGTVTFTKPLDFGQKLSLLTVLQCCLNATGLQLNTNLYANLIEATQTYSQSFLEQTLVDPSSFMSDDVNYQDCYTVLTNVMQRFNMSIFQAKGEWHVMRWDELRLFSNAIPYYKYDPSFVRIYNDNSFSWPNVSAVQISSNASAITLIGYGGKAYVGDYITLSEIAGGTGDGAYSIIEVDYQSGPSLILIVNAIIPTFIGAAAIVEIKGKSFLSENFNTGLNLDIRPITGLTKRPFRPFQYDKETFNYKQPANLLQNGNLTVLGPLLRTYTNGQTGGLLQTIYEYAMPYWTNLKPGPPANIENFIRITQDYLGNEVSRYAIVRGLTLPSTPPLPDLGDLSPIVSSPIEVNAGDYAEFDFTFRITQGAGGSTPLAVVVKITDGVHTYYARNNTDANGIWGTPSDWLIPFDGTINEDTTANVKVQQPIPISGVLTVQLAQYVYTPAFPNGETWFKDLKFIYTPTVAQSTKVNGQTHETFQEPLIKNNEDIEIFLDVCARSSISGVLYLAGKTNLSQNKAGQFIRIPGNEAQNLGQITTTEQLFWRRITRSLCEGSFFGLTQNGNHISMLSTTNLSGLSGLNFIFGKLSIDYRNNQYDCTSYEIYKNGEKDSDLAADYDFEYLYSAQ